MAIALSASAGRGYSCPAFEYTVTSTDTLIPKLYTHLVMPVRDPFGDGSGSGGEGGPGSVLDDDANAVDDEEEVEVFEAHLSAPWLAWLSPIGVNLERLPANAIQPTNALPAVVNTTRLADPTSEISYVQAPFSVLKAAVPIRSISCIKRAFVTIEGGTVGDYVAWCAFRTRPPALAAPHPT